LRKTAGVTWAVGAQISPPFIVGKDSRLPQRYLSLHTNRHGRTPGVGVSTKQGCWGRTSAARLLLNQSNDNLRLDCRKSSEGRNLQEASCSASRRWSPQVCLWSHALQGEVTGSTNKCATTFHSSYNPKVLDQCVDVCIKCNHGIMTTCSASCTLRGAR
jgi:hypothetical protein